MNVPSDHLLDLLGNDLNRRIIALTSEEERPADDIAERCDASLPTVYRHVDDLRSADLLLERTEFDSNGNHFKNYRTSLESLTVTLADGDLQVTVDSASGEAAAGDPPENGRTPDADRSVDASSVDTDRSVDTDPSRDAE